MKTYLLCHSQFLFAKRMEEHLDGSPLVEHWQRPFAGTFVVVSESSARELSAEIREAFPSGLTFIVTEVAQNRHGWLLKTTWDIIKNPESYSKENRDATLLRRLEEAEKKRKK